MINVKQVASCYSADSALLLSRSRTANLLDPTESRRPSQAERPYNLFKKFVDISKVVKIYFSIEFKSNRFKNDTSTRFNFFVSREHLCRNERLIKCRIF